MTGIAIAGVVLQEAGGTRADAQLPPEALYYVSPGGDDGNPGTREAPWQSPEHAGEVVGAGDTVVFLPGDYSGRLVPRNSGTAEAPIVFRAAERRRARLVGTAEGDWGRGETPRVFLEDISHVSIEGFHIEDTGDGGWLRTANASHVTIKDCRFQGGTRWAPFWIEDSEQVRILDNDFSRRTQGGDMGRIVASSRLLFEGNSFSRALHTLMGFHLPAGGSPKIVVRGNVFHSGWSRNLSNVGQPEVLIENNIFTNAYNGGRSAGSINQFAGNRNVIRFNRVYRNFGPPWLMSSVERAPGRPTENARFYHNVVSGNHGAGLLIHGDKRNFRDFILKNSIFEDNDPYGSRTQVSISGGGSESVRVVNNALYAGDEGVPSLVLLGHDPLGLEAARSESAVFSDNLERAAGFADSGNFDFSLVAGSPMRDAAAALTRTLTAGSGRELPVEDPFYFYDGYGIDGEIGDLIAVGETSHRARVVEVDFDRRLLKLDRELEWEMNAPVAFPWAGAGPDMGVYEHGDEVRPSVQVVVYKAFPEAGEEVELRAVTRGIEGPLKYEWHLGGDFWAEGKRVTHQFEPGYDYGIRVRVTDDEERTYMGVGYVNAEPPQDEEVLLHTTFDADDEEWWVHWQFYRGRRGTGYARYTHHIDDETGRGYHRIAALNGGGPIPAIVHPRNWDIEKYPTVRIRYQIRPGTPVAIFVTPYPSAYYVKDPWDFRIDRRRHFLAGTESEPHGEGRLVDDGEWHEITLDVSGIAEAFPGVRMIQALHIGDLEDYGGTEVGAEDEFWLDEIQIAK